MNTLDKIIHTRAYKAKDVRFYKDINLMLVILNNGMVLKLNIDDYSRLKNATEAQLNDWRLIGKGFGIHWEQLDEDLSIKGFLKKHSSKKVQSKEEPVLV